MRRLATRFLPFICWFKGYKLAFLRNDLVAGITVALLLIPQSMAYAQLAGLPVQYGLYASVFPPMVAALFGSSRQLATGPVAVVSLMTSASLAPLATAGSNEYIVYAVLLAFTVGLFQFALGVLKLGLVVNFLSHPVVNGFTNGAAIIIATSQLSKLFGVFVDDSKHHYETVYGVLLAAMRYTHWPTLAFGIAAFAFMLVIKRINPRIPYVLLAVAVATGIAYAIGFEYNTKADIAQIDSIRTRELIERFNLAASEVRSLSQERTDLNRMLDRSVQADGARSIEALKTQNEIDLVNLKIDLAGERSSLSRSKIRELLFVGVPLPKGAMRFVPEGESAGLKNDGRIWRIKVGAAPIKTDSIRMIGGGSVVGEVPRGLPALELPAVDLNVIMRLLSFAAIISLLGFMEAISIAKAMAAKTGHRLDPNQELIGQGLANMVGSIGSSYPVSGSFSRSAVNLQAGAVTGLSSVITSLAVVIVLFFMTPLLYHLPQPVLAAVIMMAVVGLINVSGFIHAWKAKRFDGAISVISFISTLFFAPHLDKGIMVGVGLSLVVFLYKSMRPKVVTLSLHEKALGDAAVYGLKSCAHIAVVRFDGPLFFANASYLEDKIAERIRSMPELKHILVVASGINDMDASGEEALSLVVDRVRAAGYQISLCDVKERVMGVFRRTHLLEKIGEEHIFYTLNQAIDTIYPVAHVGSSEEKCPLIAVCPDLTNQRQQHDKETVAWR
ncbi:MAG: STAS domain-containing protein [Deltaproteobacteria bacterium]|nr:STAS domain-containing protein [Deltaproteobacteria bacterium]